MAFHEVQFDPALSKGAVGGPMYATVVIAVGSGAEQRVGQWSRGRYRWEVAHLLKTTTQADGILSFFHARSGRLYAFRFKDWSDYQVTSPVLTTVLSSTTFQLVKRYTSGGVEYVRTIKKPVAGSVHVWHAASEVLSGWSLDTTTGILTFGSAPGYTPGWTGEFDCAVRFDTDELRMRQSEVTYRDFESIPVVEVLI